MTAWPLSARSAAGLLGPQRVYASPKQSCIRTKTYAALDDDVPLLAAVLDRAGRVHEAPFHVPGHKRGRGAPEPMRRLLAAPGGPLSCDLTELAGLDYLASPAGVIAAAQARAAEAFGAATTFFLVNGCTAGVHAAVMATCPPGTVLVAARNAHMSVFNAAALAGCDVEWAAPEEDATHGVAHGVIVAALEAAIERARAAGRRIGAALVVSPTYFGALSPVAELAAAAHRAGVPLIVDEAHGGHLTPAAAQLPGSFPRGALEAGADLVAHSTHKALAAMTQGAMLHVSRGAVARGYVDPSRVQRCLQALQTSSPSYLVLASLDAARSAAFAPDAWAGPLAVAVAARSGLAPIPGLSLVGGEDKEEGDEQCSSSSISGGSSIHSGVNGGRREHDPLRLSVNVAKLGLTGFEAAARLEQRSGVVAELATARLVVLAVGPGSRRSDADTLVAGFADLARGAAAAAASATDAAPAVVPQQQQQQQQQQQLGEQRQQQTQHHHQHHQQHQHQKIAAPISPREALFAPTERVPLAAAVGRLSAELLCPYPPGVPVAVPGEPLTAAAVAALQGTLASNGAVVGASDATLATVLVVAARAAADAAAAAG